MDVKHSVLIEDEDYVVTVDEAGGHIFFHMNVINWNKITLKKMRSQIDLILKHYHDKGFDLVFATTDEEKTTKFWKCIHPYDILQKFGPNKKYWIGAWYTEDKNK